jgi:enterochelin esterase-like enzyme
MGAMSGAVIASYTALKAPGTFGKLALQTFFFWEFEETLTALVGELAPGQLAAYVEISSNDFNVAGFDAAADSRKLISLLRARGIPVEEQNVSGAPSWGSWRAQTGIILGWFAPPER